MLGFEHRFGHRAEVMLEVTLEETLEMKLLRLRIRASSFESQTRRSDMRDCRMAIC